MIDTDTFFDKEFVLPYLGEVDLFIEERNSDHTIYNALLLDKNCIEAEIEVRYSCGEVVYPFFLRVHDTEFSISRKGVIPISSCA